MKILMIRDKKTRKIDYVPYYESGPVPPLINPPRPNEPKDELSKEDQETRKRKPA
jgi:hypothetical protein